MLLPPEILCDKCGQPSQVLTRTLNNEELAGAMPRGDVRWTEGFYVRIRCPDCGEREQSIAPPP